MIISSPHILPSPTASPHLLPSPLPLISLISSPHLLPSSPPLISSPHLLLFLSLPLYACVVVTLHIHTYIRTYVILGTYCMHTFTDWNRASPWTFSCIQCWVHCFGFSGHSNLSWEQSHTHLHNEHGLCEEVNQFPWRNVN